MTIHKSTALIASACLLLICTAQAATSSFQDTFTLNFENFPTSSFVNVSYQNDALSQITISGPHQIETVDSPGIYISTNNPFQIINGYPIMTLAYVTLNGPESCTLDFVDGPLTTLSFKNGVAPVCPGITISNVQPVDPAYLRVYSITITNTDSPDLK